MYLRKIFEKLLSDNSFKIIKTEDVGRRQLAYSITNHNKGHYILFNLEGDPSKLLELETKIKYNESIIRHLFLVVKEHNGEDSSLFIESKNKKPEPVEEVAKKERKSCSSRRSSWNKKRRTISRNWRRRKIAWANMNYQVSSIIKTQMC